MDKRFKKLLEKQLGKLDADDFDLEAWKSGTVTLLMKTFGANDASVKQIEALKIDYSSWALRDSSSSYKPMETCKRKGREVLSSAIDELEIGESTGDVLDAYYDRNSVKALLSPETSDKEKLKILDKLKKDDLKAIALRLFE